MHRDEEPCAFFEVDDGGSRAQPSPPQSTLGADLHTHERPLTSSAGAFPAAAASVVSGNTEHVPLNAPPSPAAVLAGVAASPSSSAIAAAKTRSGAQPVTPDAHADDATRGAVPQRRLSGPIHSVRRSNESSHTNAQHQHHPPPQQQPAHEHHPSGSANRVSSNISVVGGNSHDADSGSRDEIVQASRSKMEISSDIPARTDVTAPAASATPAASVAVSPTTSISSVAQKQLGVAAAAGPAAAAPADFTAGAAAAAADEASDEDTNERRCRGAALFASAAHDVYGVHACGDATEDDLSSTASGVQATGSTPPAHYTTATSRAHRRPSCGTDSGAGSITEMDVNTAAGVEGEEEEAGALEERAGSPLPHRRCRPRGPPVAAVMTADSAAAAAASAAGGERSSAKTHLVDALVYPHSHSPLDPHSPRRGVLLARPASDDSINLSIHSSSGSSGGEQDEDRGVGSMGRPAAARDAAGRGGAASSLAPPGQPHACLHAGFPHGGDGMEGEEEEDDMDLNSHRSDNDEGDAYNASTASSPTAVTLWGVDRDLRRKRIKKVSHYILGPLLGEGTYGAVRDCIDLSTDNVDRRFSRCAIKIVAGNFAKLDTPAAKPSKHSAEAASSAAAAGATGGAAHHPADAPDATAATPVATPTLKRTSGLQYRREEDVRRQEMFQREMRNLQRFHSKNIIRAQDTFTRYSKEYVVLPIAICNLQQLVRQLLCTRWREAVREWRRTERRRLRRLQRQYRREGKGRAEGEKGEVDGSAPRPPQLPFVPSAMGELDLDDLVFMMDGAEENELDCTRSDADETDDHDNSVTGSASPARSGSDGEDGGSERCDSAAAAAAAAAAGHQGTNGKSRTAPSKHDHDPLHHKSGSKSNNNNGHHHAREAAKTAGLVASAESCTSTTRTIDSYANASSRGSARHRDARARTPHAHYPAFAGGRRLRSDSDADEHGDGDVDSESTTWTSTGIAVMSATPPALDSADLTMYDGGKDGPSAPLPHEPLHESGDDDADDVENSLHRAAAAPATPIAAGTARTGCAAGLPSRPRLVYPMCSPTLLKGIMYQVISGVAYLHQQHLAHNDLKPSNVLMFEDGTVKLGDLGSVHDAYNDQGSPLYASPELCKYFYGAATPPVSFSKSTQHVGRDAAQTSDMWCCGLILYYLITGKPGPLPVQRRYFQTLHSKHGNGVNATPQQRTPTTAAAPSVMTPPVPVTRYQLYREIAQQTAPVDLSELPDMVPPEVGEDAILSGMPTTTTAASSDSVTGAAAATAAASALAESGASAYLPNSVRHLLAGLLELDPQRRLTAEQALRHPWLRMAFRSKTGGTTTNPTSSNATPQPGGSADGGASASHQHSPSQQQQQQRKPPSKQAMEEAIQKDVARRVMESRHVQHMLRLDRQRHLQFVADCCHMLNLTIPAEIIKVSAEEPYREEFPSADAAAPPQRSLSPALQAYRPNSLAAAAAAVAGRNTRLEARAAAAAAAGGGSSPSGEWMVSGRAGSGGGAATGMALREAYKPSAMPTGCVDTELFLPHSEEDYYEQKSGKSEFDVRVLRRKPLLMAQLYEYFHNVVLVQCGYRTAPDPHFQAMRVRAVDEDSYGRRGHGGRGSGGDGGSIGGASSGSAGPGGFSGARASTQQPSVMILPGASGSVYRRTPAVGLATVPSAASVVTNATDDLEDDHGAAQANGNNDNADGSGGVEGPSDVWGAGPRHQPRVRVGDHGEVIVSSSKLTGPASASRYGRGGYDLSLSGAAVAAAAEAAAAAAARAASSARASNSSSSAANAGPAEQRPHTPVVYTTRDGALAAAGGRQGTGGRAGRVGRAAAGRGGGGQRRDASESPSEEEVNVAMRESSKCLCGLV